MDRDRNNADLWCGKHHDRRYIGAGQCRQKFCMTGIFETGFVKHAFLDWVGHDRGGTSCARELNGLLDCRDNGAAIRRVQLSGDWRDGKGYGQNGKGALKDGRGIFRLVYGLDRYVLPDQACKSGQTLGIVQQEERREAVTGGSPRLEGDLGTGSRRLSRADSVGQRSRT